MYWTTSNALALSWMDELEPLNWKILDFVSRIKMSSWLSDARTKGIYYQQKQINMEKDTSYYIKLYKYTQTCMCIDTPIRC